jgi:hypothetical protein
MIYKGSIQKTHVNKPWEAVSQGIIVCIKKLKYIKGENKK